MAKHRKPSYYAVRVGRKPGVYRNWEECQQQVSKFSKAVFKGFDTYDDALAFVGDNIPSNQGHVEDEVEDLVHDENPISSGSSPDVARVKFEDDAALMPPPASQSYFDQFPNFAPDNSASFDDEFHRFASSQGLVSGSQEYRRERTRAIRDELKFHYSSQPNNPAETSDTIPELGKETLDEQSKLEIYQNMCREIGVDPRDTITDCRRELKKVLVNIIDYIDARRIGKKVEIWEWANFHEFSRYSLQDDKRIDRNEAKADGGFLSALLQQLTGSGPRRRKALASTAVGSEKSKRKRTDQKDCSFSKRTCLSFP
ncbi:Caulimovirus viroplasmin-domain-containing protein [Hypoxylon sp. FL0890]|nr:Caulimovirus viroplasmin-domain-containing protein [Hypoxylon sp. FL0890]